MTSAIHYQSLSNQLVFQDSVFPKVVINQQNFQSLKTAIEWVKENKVQLEQTLACSGVVLFRGFPVNDAHTFDAFSAAFNYPTFTYKESLSNAVRINYTDRVFTANEAPKDVEIHLHHEMAQTPVSPDKLFFFCQSAALTGGATPVCRSDLLYNALKAQAPSLANDFLNKGLKYTTLMPADDNHQSGQGRSWKSTLSVDNKVQAESKLSDLGYSWKWLECGGLTAITPVLPAVKSLDNGKQVFYNQLIAAYMGWEGVRDDPSKAICFGDGCAITVEALELIVSLAKQFTYDLQWQDGDIALIDNKMAMHGRRPFGGKRKRQVLVALVA